uniref:Uncharacterized protein n=1 Tax=Ascaris lumbricoides TaxID=6252 RepID=A0A0M3HXI4_ASCLU
MQVSKQWNRNSAASKAKALSQRWTTRDGKTAPIVVVKKASGNLHICPEFSTGLNEALEFQKYSLRLLEDIFARRSVAADAASLRSTLPMLVFWRWTTHQRTSS